MAEGAISPFGSRRRGFSTVAGPRARPPTGRRTAGRRRSSSAPSSSTGRSPTHAPTGRTGWNGPRTPGRGPPTAYPAKILAAKVPPRNSRRRPSPRRSARRRHLGKRLSDSLSRLPRWRLPLSFRPRRFTHGWVHGASRREEVPRPRAAARISRTTRPVRRRAWRRPSGGCRKDSCEKDLRIEPAVAPRPGYCEIAGLRCYNRTQTPKAPAVRAYRKRHSPQLPQSPLRDACPTCLPRGHRNLPKTASEGRLPVGV